MTGREIVTALVRDKTCPERMGLFEDYWPDTQEAWEAEGLPKGVKLFEYFNYDIHPSERFAVNTAPFIEQKIIEEDDKTYVYDNGWGARMREWKKRAGTPEHIHFDLTSEEIWRKKYREPLLSLDPRRLGDIDALKRHRERALASSRFAVWEDIHIFEIMRKSLGDVVMLEAMCMNPGWITDFCAVVTNNLIVHFDYLFREVGKLDGVFIYEDMGYTQGPFVSPSMYRALVFPWHKKLVDFVHSHNMPILMHACGKVEPLLPHIAETGIDCLTVLEAKAGQHVVRMAESLNRRLAFAGNLDIRAFESNDRKKLEDEILPKLKAIREKRIPFLFHSDHSIPKTVRLDTYRYALDLHRKYGTY